ncbi:MAG: hypothetical protein AB4426_29395 [Xenococcaceae cyanobacterium]
MAFPSCSLWILVARTDIPFMMHTIPHLVGMSNFPFRERVLAVDTAPLSGDKLGRPGIGTMAELRDRTEELLKTGVVDRVVDINYDPGYRDRVYRKHFGSLLRQTHNYKGYPILGTIFTIEEAQSDYMLHFDSDMLLHQKSDYSWVEEGMKLMEKHPEIMSFRPLTGPPRGDGSMYQRMPYEKDPNGFYKFKFFGSRVYLINCKGFEELLPLPIIWRPYRRKFMDKLPVKLQTTLNYITGKGALDSWEIMVSKQLERTDYFRGTLANPQAWTLHPKDRSPEFIQALPQIIEKIEAGEYPPEQAGYYDLKLEFWI